MSFHVQQGVLREHWLFYWLCILQTSPNNIATASSSSFKVPTSIGCSQSSLSLSLSLPSLPPPSLSLAHHGCLLVVFLPRYGYTDIQCQYSNRIYSQILLKAVVCNSIPDITILMIKPEHHFLYMYLHACMEFYQANRMHKSTCAIYLQKKYCH